MNELNFTPFPELKTERLLLRKLTGNDANKIFFLRSDENVLRFLSREPAELKQSFYFRGNLGIHRFILG